jgi:two-component system, LytTR family, sensor kinase
MPLQTYLSRWINDFLFDRPPYRRWRGAYHAAFWSVELLVQLYIYRDLHPVAKPAFAWVEGGLQVLSNALIFYTIVWWWYRFNNKQKIATFLLLFIVLISLTFVLTYWHDSLIIQYELLPKERAYWELIQQRYDVGFGQFYLNNWLSGHIIYRFINPQSLCFIIKLMKEAARYTNRSILLEQDNLKFAKENLDLELSFLKAQVNPHFFFNTLNTLYSLSIKKSDLTPDLIMQLSDLMRYALYNTDNIRSPLQQEIDFLHNYLAIEKIRFGPRVELDFSVEGDATNHTIPPLLLILFVENAFKHGIKNELKAGWVRIRLTMTPARVHFLIVNSIPVQAALSKPLRRTDREGGIGLQNAQRRLSILYPARHTLHLMPSTGQYSVELELLS